MNKYSGNKKAFIYVISSSEDEKVSCEILDKLKDYAFSFDNSVALKKAGLTICFVSKDLLNNEIKLKEVSKAFENKRNILPIFLDDVVLPPGLSMLFGSTQGIYKNNISEEEFYEKLLGSPLISNLEISAEQKRDSKKRTIGLSILIVVLLMAIIVYTSGMFNFITPDSLLNKIGISGRVNDVKEIYLYGDELLDDFYISQIQNFRSDDASIIVNRQKYNLGDISDLSDFAVCKNLEKLSLAGNKVKSIEPLYGLDSLKLLDLTGNNSISIAGISKLKNLEVLNLTKTDVTNYEELLQMSNLKTVYVSGDNYDSVCNLEGRQFEVISTDTIVKSYDELKKAVEDENTFSIMMVESVVVPTGETITIKKDVCLQGHGNGKDASFYFENNGSIILEGCFELGLCTRANNGTIIIKDGGLYTGGMCNTDNYGSFIIEKGGQMDLERAHQFSMNDGNFENNGDIYFNVANSLFCNGGSFINNGSFYFNSMQYGGIQLNGSNFVDNGHYYYSYTGEENTLNPDYQETTLDYLLEKSFAN